MHRSRRGWSMALAGAALALTPATAHAQFPDVQQGQVRWAASASSRARCSTQYFNQITPENGGKWGVAAGTTRTAAMRWGQLDTAYNYARGQRHEVQLPRAAVGQPAADVDGDPAARGAARRDQEVVRGRGRALPEDRVAAGRQRADVGSAGRHDAEERRRELRLQRQLRAGARRRRRDGLRLDPHGVPAREAVLPEHQADAQRRRDHGPDRVDRRVPEDHQHPQGART